MAELFGNFTGIDFFDIIRTMLVDDFFGSFELAIVGVILFLMLLLLIIGSRREAVLLVPTPFVVSLANVVPYDWIRIMIFILTGFYLFIIVFALFKSEI